ncbi:MAG: sugar phosphate isomerase/epimerase family protein [Bryobacterales bacterium]|nr:sugar phosphate isomerase/epimerase family protein [Bryobacterales bacterium]
MRSAREMELGAMFWATTTPLETLKAIKKTGVTCGQLGFEGSIELTDDLASGWKAALEAEDFPIVTCFVAYNGEEYPDIPTVADTVGFVPERFRTERMARTRAVSDFAAKLGVGAIGLHIGCVPEDDTHPDYLAVLGMVREIADHAAAHGQTFALETGQETAVVLREFLDDVKRPNVRINFDPANMILYGSGDPIEALDVLGNLVVTVHAKDGLWPAGGPESLGIEKVLGTGDVGMRRFVAKLREIGYQGPLCIEREGVTWEQKLIDIEAGVAELKDALA